jgi:hypothetical protein
VKAVVNRRMIIGFNKNRISGIREIKLQCLTIPHTEDTYNNNNNNNNNNKNNNNNNNKLYKTEILEN